ncbi:hypothetical protein H4R19_001090 [Coemansia spiralis]|nr:hypothetical protein H4R19_001090 [Coemansia spiralis]
MRLTQRPLSRREGNLNESQAVSDPSSAWRTYACMAPFAAADNTSLLMVYGGTSSAAKADPLSAAAKGSGTLQVFDVGGAKWYAPATANAPKTAPVLPGCAAAAGSIWVYDPHYGAPSSAAAAVVDVLDSVHWSWSSPTEQGQLPVARFGAAFAYVPDKHALYMHGGIALSDDTNTASSQSGTVNNLDIFSPQDLAWAYASNGPARRYHTMCYMDAIQAIVLFGGADNSIASYNDVKLLHTATNTWSYSPQISGDGPAARILHSAVCSADSMFVFGGQHTTGDEPSDSTVWVLKADNASSLTWSKAPIAGKAQGAGPTARAGHSAAIHDDSMYIFGGIGPSGQDSTMYKLDLRSWEWLQTSAAGTDAREQDGKSHTAVIIAAIVSSVLGIIVVGIAATVVYRVVRRRYGTLPRLRHARSGTIDSLGTADMSGSIDASEHRDKDAGDRRDSAANDAGGSSSAAAYRHVFAGQPASFIPTPHSPAPHPRPPAHLHEARLATARSQPPLQDTAGPSGSRVGGPGAASAMSTPQSLATEMSPNPTAASSSSTSGWHFAESVRARARSLSQRIVSARPSESTRHPSPRRRPTVASQLTTEAIMYGSDYARAESEYRQAEAINQILLSGQPIPSWLRDAVNQAQGSEADKHPLNAQPAADPPAAVPERQPLTVTNNPPPQQPDDG